MAYDTSMLTPDVHRRLRDGETIENLASTFGISVAAVEQYLRKIDASGRSILGSK